MPVVLTILLALVLTASSGEAGTLQSRLDAARAGDTIVVGPGVYGGNLLLTKKLMLLGIGRPTIHGTGEGSTVTLAADSCTLRGFRIEHCGTRLVEEDAGVLVKSNRNLIEDNVLGDILFGIYFLHADKNRTVGNRISGRRSLELGERGSGIHIWNSRWNDFAGNVITDVRDGFYIQNASHMMIEGNEAYGVRYGLHYMYADSNTFIANRFHDNVAGAAIMYSRGITMRRNEFVRNRGVASFGVLFQDCQGLTADSNIIADNVTGLFFEGSRNNVFRHNIIAANDAALEMFQNSTENTFSENSFIDNLSPLLLVGRKTDTRWSERGKGNYWSSYDGYDLDGDGIGDVPMKIQNVFDYLEGKNPNVRLYLYSPASQALAASAKAFPIIDINHELDEHPLMEPPTGSIVQSEASRLDPRGGNRALVPSVGLALGGLCIAGLANTFLRRARG